MQLTGYSLKDSDLDSNTQTILITTIHLCILNLRERHTYRTFVAVQYLTGKVKIMVIFVNYGSLALAFCQLKSDTEMK